MNRFLRPVWYAALLLIACCVPLDVLGADPTREDVLQAMKKAATYYHDRVAVHGGYVYYSSLDGKVRIGEGEATPSQIWIEPPGTPTVGMAYLTAYQATQDELYLNAAIDAARALAYGQLKSGGWTHLIDFDPASKDAGAYRNGKGGRRNNSSLDDGITQSALTFLMRIDQVLKFQDREIHDAASTALDALLNAQFANGGFSQVWVGPAEPRPVIKARFPDYDWRTEHRMKEYWAMYTLNDDVARFVAETLVTAHEVYQDPRAISALRKLGDFLILAQLPDPQPAWAQQYDKEMCPAWARKFEPPAVTGDESEDAMEALLIIHAHTDDAKYLEPIPRAIAYLRRSLLPDGRLARFYELKTNKPLYMNSKYELTYDDNDVPQHYAWKVPSHLDQLEKAYERAANGMSEKQPPPRTTSVSEAKKVLNDLDLEGRWLITADTARLKGQPEFKLGDKYLSSDLFSRNLTLLARYVGGAK